MEPVVPVEIDEYKFPVALRRAIGFSRVLDVDRESKRCVVEFEARPEFTHSGGTTVQGGIISVWIDHAMAWVVHVHDPRCAVASLELKTTYLARVGPGRVVVEASALRIGRTAAFLDAKVLGPQGETLATASSTALVIQR